jgi:hypothetical protein
MFYCIRLNPSKTYVFHAVRVVRRVVCVRLLLCCACMSGGPCQARCCHRSAGWARACWALIVPAYCSTHPAYRTCVQLYAPARGWCVCGGGACVPAVPAVVGCRVPCRRAGGGRGSRCSVVASQALRALEVRAVCSVGAVGVRSRVVLLPAVLGVRSWCGVPGGAVTVAALLGLNNCVAGVSIGGFKGG